MSRRKPISSHILEAANQFDAKEFYDSVRGSFADFPDHRFNKKRVLYPTWYLFLIILCGFFCGCNTIEELSEYALLQQEWFNTLLGGDYKAPSYSTFWWFLVRTNPTAFKQYLGKWFVNVPNQLKDQLLAIDGKRLKSANFLGGITHLVELFAAGDRLVLAVEKVPDKTVEKSTLPDILAQLNVSGAIISGDAHFTVPETAAQIVDNNADYLLPVKSNQPNLQAEMENFFSQAHEVKWEGVENASFAGTVEKDHGRIETREVRAVQNLDWLPQRENWKDLKSLVEVKSVREWVNSDKKETHTRYYISSRDAKASDFSEWIREHWGIENSVHWVADVIFFEDKAQTDVGHSAENLGIIRRLAMNIASSIDPTRGMASVRRAATFGSSYLKGLLAKIFLNKKRVKNF